MSFRGRTSGFDPDNEGSNPSMPSKSRKSWILKGDR